MDALDVGSSTIKSAGFQNLETWVIQKKPKSDLNPNSRNSPHVQKPAIFRYKRCIRDRKAQFAFHREQSNNAQKWDVCKIDFRLSNTYPKLSHLAKTFDFVRRLSTKTNIVKKALLLTG